ncbi:MAG: NAD(P)H-dependent oxidoreductase, partial [Mesorhizobium sp.]
EKSSTDRLLADVLAALMQYEVKGEIVRALSHDIKPGVLSDMGSGDDWPELRKKILTADIFVLGLPIW